MPIVTPAEAPFILTIDAGTSSVRALLFNAHGRAVEGVVAQEHYDIHSTAAGAAEDDANAAFERICRCVDSVLAQAGELATQIRGVAVDTLVSNILAIDEAGQPITPVVIYADTRNAADTSALQRRLGEQAVHQRTGCLLRTSYWPARLAWFKRTQPTVWRAAARWITLGEYLELRLFGTCRVSTSVAAWSGLLDRQRLVWDAPLVAALDLRSDQLSPLVDVSEPLQGLQPVFAERWPQLRAVPWFPAIGDGAAANIGSGCTGTDRIALTVGTTGALRVVIDQPEMLTEVPNGLWCYRVDRERALLGGATSEGGNVYAWMQQALKLGAPAVVEQALAEMPPDSHGLTMLPFLAGERSPGWAGDVRATITGLGLNTTPLEILRAGLESVAYRFALIFDLLVARDSAAARGQTVIASGGALLNSPAWMQIIADAIGRPIVASDETEATSRGIALLALAALQAIPSVDALPATTGATYTPNPNNHAIYQAAITRQRTLYKRFYDE